MAYTSTDLENLERAAVALGVGSRKEAVTLQDGTRVEFTPVTLPQLRSLISEIRSSIASSATSTRRGFFLVSTSKGF